MQQVLPPRLTQPLTSLAAWTAYFVNAEIPIQAETVFAIEEFRLMKDQLDANMLGELIAADPLMSLKLMARAAQQRGKALDTDPQTITAVLVWMGIGPFFSTFPKQPAVGNWLADSPKALQGLQNVLRRSDRAARFALSFALQRADYDAAIIYLATLLHDFAEMLLWCHAPAIALLVEEAEINQSHMSLGQIQQKILGIELAELQQSLMQAWRLPDLLIRIANDKESTQAKVRNVMLAVRLARNSATGWQCASVMQDLHEIAVMLNLSETAVFDLVQEIDS